jgi:hypothetical protein
MTEEIRDGKHSEFRPQARNANSHTDRGMEMLESSIDEVGWIGAITVAADGEVFDGSARHEVAGRALPKDAVVIDHDGKKAIYIRRTDIPNAKDPRAVKAGILANRTAEVNLEWDTEALEAIGEEIDLTPWFTDEEMAGWGDAVDGDWDAPSDEEDEEATADLIEEAEQGAIECRFKLGDIIALGRHRIACGDSTDEGNVRKLLGDRFGGVGMVWSDAPYGIDAVSKEGKTGTGQPTPFGGAKNRGTKVKSISATIYSPVIGDDSTQTAESSCSLLLKLFPDSLQVWWGANHFSKPFPPSSCWIVWDKETDGNNFADAELAWCSSKTTVRIFRHMWQGMVKASEHGQKRVHPTQKPIALCEWAFEKYGTPNDLIFDPFLGSAPSIIAAQKMDGDRTVYGMELSPEYIEIICRRFEGFTGITAELAGHL